MTTNAEPGGRFLGLYRATVVDNNDLEKRGRLQVTVPDVLGSETTTWAEACAPLAGPTGLPMGFYIVPPVGAGVWVEFERGDHDHPVWVGCRWGSQADIPTLAHAGNPAAPNIVVQTLGQHMLMIGDAPPTPATGGIVLKSASGAMVVVNDSGIYISNGQGATINLVGPTVQINNGALAIT
jgi:uncharacterized protein involved in type VI secretion and phage assembly